MPAPQAERIGFYLAPMSDSPNLAAERFKGFCFDYDKFRPVPPVDLMELAFGWTLKKELDLVVDLGCGTGLSTRPWASFASQVIGVDPSRDMLDSAVAGTGHKNVRYVLGFGHDTGLVDASADIVTCSSAVHWMEPTSTRAEVLRILKPGGVFMVYGHYFPVFLNSPSLTRFYERWRRNLDDLEYRAEAQQARKWPLSELYGQIEGDQRFMFCRKHYLHSKLLWTPDAIAGYFRAHAGVPFLLSRGYTEADLLLDELAVEMNELEKAEAYSLHLTYSVFIAIKASTAPSQG